MSGTPTGANVGLASNIVITVTDGTVSASLPRFSIEVVAVALGSATLTWTPPTTYTDGSALILAGYKIYWGQDAQNMSNSADLNTPGTDTYIVEDLTPATWYFAVSVVDTAGVESELSNIASKTIL